MPHPAIDAPHEDGHEHDGDVNADADADAEMDDTIFRDLTFDEVIEDLNTRFLVNLPEEERTLIRLCFQAEEAYVDLICPRTHG
jgi:hypothetical protein